MVNSLAPCGRGLGRGVEQEPKILRPSAEILGANPMTNAQNDRKYTLSNGRGKKKPAFTLAEVLVTLGIIGVVAAMTIPMLAKNYQFFIRQQQFKKAYAALNIAVQKTQIDMGEGVRCFYTATDDYSGTRNECSYFFSEMARNLQIIKTCNGNALEGKCVPKELRGGDTVFAEVQGNDSEEAKEYFYYSCGGFSSNRIRKTAVVYVVNSGFTIIPYENGAGIAPIFLLDINADKGPNKWGHDIFPLWFEKTRKSDSVFKLVPTKRCHALDVGGYYITEYVEYLYGQNAEL